MAPTITEKQLEWRFVFINGTDAGYWWIGPDGRIHHGGGWEAEQLQEVVTVINILGQASKLKTPGIAEQVTHGLAEFAQKQIAQHLGGGEAKNTILIIGGQIQGQ